MPVPGRVDAAMSYLRFAEDLKNPPPRFDGQRIEPQDLSDSEQATRDAALDVLRRYFTGEAHFGDDPPLAVASKPETTDTTAVPKPA